MFPVHMKGSILVRSVRVAGAVPPILSTIAQGLSSARARGVQIDGGSVTFRAGLFRLVSSINLLAAVTRGRVSVCIGPDGTRLDYDLCFTGVLAAAVAGAGFLGIAGLIGVGLAPSKAVVLGVCSFVFFFAGNVFLARARFRAFLRKCVMRAAELD